MARQWFRSGLIVSMALFSLAQGFVQVNAAERVTLNVVVGADVNVVDVHKTLLAPGFKEKNPGVDFNIAVTSLIVLIAAGLFAGFIPAKKAVSIKPVEALRAE